MERGGSKSLGSLKRLITSLKSLGRWPVRSESVRGILVNSGTKITRSSHSLIVGSSSRSNMSATPSAVFKFVLLLRRSSYAESRSERHGTIGSANDLINQINNANRVVWFILLRGEVGKMLLEVLIPHLLVPSHCVQLLAGFAWEGHNLFVVGQVPLLSLFPEVANQHVLL